MRLEANKALGAMLERATMSERIKSVLSLLKRYESLFALPMRMRQQMQRQEYDQVHGPAFDASCSCFVQSSSIICPVVLWSQALCPSSSLS